MPNLPRPLPSQPIVGFVQTRCPRCHRRTSYLSFESSAVISCTWSNCGYTWFKSAEQAIADPSRDPDERHR